MSVGIASTLLQPQTLARMAGRSREADLGDELLALVHRIVMDPAALEAVLPAFKRAGEAVGNHLQARITEGLPRALPELRGVFQPCIQSFIDLGSGDAPQSPADLLLKIADAVDALSASLDSLSDDGLRALVRRLAAVFSETLGLDRNLIRDTLALFFNEARAGLLEGVTAMSADAAATRMAVACALRRVEPELYGVLPSFDLNPNRLADLLIAELRRTGITKLRDQGECLLGKLKAVLGAVAEIARLVAGAQVGGQLAPPVPHSLKASKAMKAAPGKRMRAKAGPNSPALASTPPAERSDDGTYCWYASWLYATRRQTCSNNTPGAALAMKVVPGYPEDEVWLSADRKKLVLRRAGGPDEQLDQRDTPSEWHEFKQFKIESTEWFTFGPFSAPFLETWAHVTAVLVEAVAGLWHCIAMAASPKEYAVNIPLWLWNWGRACSSGIAKTPLPSLIAQKAGWGMGAKYPFSPLVPILTVLLGSLEGKHSKTNGTNCFLQWLTLLGGDAINAFTISVVTNALRSISLSVFTLINYTGPDNRDRPDSWTYENETRPKNWDMSGPLTSLVNTLLGMLFFKLISREDYGLPVATGSDAKPFVLWWIFGGVLFNFVGTFCGQLISWGFAGTVTPKQLWQEPLIATIATLIFPIQQYNTMEGDTDGGRFNPTKQVGGNAYSPARVPFAGYPDNSASPYKLPYAKDTALFVGQANLGLFSHARFNSSPQVYAFDFAHDFKDEVLCVRNGTVVDYFDWMPDDQDLSNTDPNDAAAIAAAVAAAAASGALLPNQTNGSNGGWNFILIRHDAVDNTHDKDQGGGNVQTYAQYGHGANGGVRAAFAARGVAANLIIGTAVTQGQVVMQAGDTGVSFHNHLHLHVVGALPGTAAPLPGTQQVINRNALTPYTLPFVFGDVNHVFATDGVPQHLNWYTSQNVRTG